MRILNLIPNLSGGGAERQLSYIGPELARQGHAVHVAYSQEGPSKPELPGVVLHRLSSVSNYDPYLLWQLVLLIRRIKPDVVHTWITQMDVIGGIAARINGTPWIFREPSSAKGYPATWKNRLRVRIASAASAIVANSVGGSEYWKKHLPESRRFIVPNALPLNLIDSTPAVFPESVPKPVVPMVLYAGRLSSDATGYKNLRSVIKTLALVKARKNMTAVFCGKGPQLRELQALAHSLGLGGDVCFAGHLPSSSVWALMKNAALFVSFSEYEGSPNTVMEAMACGCPLVLSDIPAHRELLDKTSALFVDPSDIERSAETVIQALSDTDASRKRAAIARQKSQAWAMTEIVRTWENVYRAVSADSSAPFGKVRG